MKGKSPPLLPKNAASHKLFLFARNIFSKYTQNGNKKGKIEILSAHNHLCGKFAVVCQTTCNFHHHHHHHLFASKT